MKTAIQMLFVASNEDGDIFADTSRDGALEGMANIYGGNHVTITKLRLTVPVFATCDEQVIDITLTVPSARVTADVV